VFAMSAAPASSINREGITATRAETGTAVWRVEARRRRGARGAAVEISRANRGADWVTGCLFNLEVKRYLVYGHRPLCRKCKDVAVL